MKDQLVIKWRGGVSYQKTAAMVLWWAAQIPLKMISAPGSHKDTIMRSRSFYRGHAPLTLPKTRAQYQRGWGGRSCVFLIWYSGDQCFNLCPPQGAILENFVDVKFWESWVIYKLLLAYGNVYGPPKFSKHVSICRYGDMFGKFEVGRGPLLDPSAAQKWFCHTTACPTKVKDRKRNLWGWYSSHLSPKALKKNERISF